MIPMMIPSMNTAAKRGQNPREGRWCRSTPSAGVPSGVVDTWSPKLLLSDQREAMELEQPHGERYRQDYDGGHTHRLTLSSDEEHDRGDDGDAGRRVRGERNEPDARAPMPRTLVVIPHSGHGTPVSVRSGHGSPA